MKTVIFILLLAPIGIQAQNKLPRFENDTLTTSGGYKIYKGLRLNLGKGTSEAGYFTFIKFHQNMAKNNTYTLENSTVLVKNLRAYKYASPDNNTIRITGTITYIDGKQEEGDLWVNFERATEDYNNLPSELNIPQSFKRIPGQTVVKPEPRPEPRQPVITETKPSAGNEDIRRILVADEIKKLFDLYKAGALTKEEFDTQKKKLLERQ